MEISSPGAAVQHNFRRKLLVPYREENISSLGAAVQHNFRRTLLVPTREENIKRISIAWAPRYSKILTRAPGGLSHLRTAGGRMTAPPPPIENSKIKKDSEKLSIGRGKFYKKIPRLIFDQVKFDVTGVKKVKFSQNRAIFTESRNYLTNYTS